MTLTSTYPIRLCVYLPLFFLLFMYALMYSWGIDAMVGIQVQGKDDGWMDKQMDGWTHIHNLCNHDNIYTDTCVYQCMIPRRVITTYTWGKILQNLKPLRVCARARARAGVCVRAGEIVNKI